MLIYKKSLIKVLRRLSEEIDLNCVDEIEIDADYFWHIASHELYNPCEDPKLMLGQISDEWNELKRLNDPDSISLSYDLKRLAVILAFLEFKLGSDWFMQAND